jgi:16S rRNA A1518/A1519 N6-dimethyltransferase RsmA/KsgA/DIM1 with predicted DNA glycosylase/AP lyase activity
MSTFIDPEENESRALFDLPIAWADSSVLEIGSGDGRLTWRYAGRVARVITIEPETEKHMIALRDRPSGFEHVEFLNLGFDEFAKQNKERFDLAILSWSL